MTKNSIKKLISILLCTITMLMQPTSMLSAKSTDVYTLGDLNGDSRITAVDARLCLRASAELETLNEKQKAAADVLGNGKVSAVAARIILQYSAEIISVFPAEQPGTTVWKEVPIGKEIMMPDCRLPFDLRERIINKDLNTYVFAGKVISRKDIEISWIDSVYGDQMGPFVHGILEVQVTKEYIGKSPLQVKNITIFFPYSLSWVSNNSVRPVENQEYVFMTTIMDEKLLAYTYEGLQDKNLPDLRKFADVYQLSPSLGLFPVVENNVIVYHEYFNYNQDVMKKVLKYDSIKTESLTNPESLKSGDFIVLSREDFEKEFLKLYENPERLPTVSLDLD